MITRASAQCPSAPTCAPPPPPPFTDIGSQGRDADFTGVRDEVLGLGHRLNQLVTEVQTTTGPALGAAPY